MDNEELKLMFIITDREVGEKYLNDLEKIGIHYGHTVYAHGTAKSDLLEVLGVGETKKVMTVCTVRNSQIPEIDKIIKEFDAVKKIKTLAFTIPISSVGGMASFRILSGVDYKTEMEEKKKTKKGGKRK